LFNTTEHKNKEKTFSDMRNGNGVVNISETDTNSRYMTLFVVESKI